MRPTTAHGHRLSATRLSALIWKESLQTIRDPSALLIAFVLPVMLLFLFAYAVSLDIRNVPIGVVLESDGEAAQSLAAAFAATRHFTVTPARSRQQVEASVAAGRLKGYVVIPHDLERRLATRAPGYWVQVVTDASQPNNANFVAGYAQGVIRGWLQARDLAPQPVVELRSRVWFNPELESRRMLVPGAIAIVMTMIGTLLTAMVVAREWERGTMEALLSTPARVIEILIGKLTPYFVLGLLATLGSALLAITVFDVPLRGSWGALLLISAVFMVPALGQGLVISVLAKNQFLASQFALFSGFLPAFLLSGFLFEIDSMPAVLRAITYIVPARYFVAALQTVFLAGDIWRVLLPAIAAMLAIGLLFFAIARQKLRRSLDP
jgi:ABC-2 type transport system permease protein